MKKVRALVTGIGTIIGYGVINSLRKSYFNVNVIGMDMNPEAVGKHWCDKFIVAEPASSENFISFIKQTIDDYKIDIVFLGTEQEMKKISEYREELGSYIDMIVINRKEVIDLTIDKWKMFLFMKMNGLIAIESTLECEDYNYLLLKYGKEFLVKPRSSYSSRGVKIICDQETFNYYKYLLGKQMMAQEVVGDSDHEFTAAAFCYGDGTCSAPIIFKRHLSFEGATLNAEVVDSQPISDSIMSLVSLLKPVGPTNFQYRTRKDCAYLLEINPRISASTSLRAAFGFNEAEMAIRFYLEKETDLRPCIKKGKATRYISDYVELL